MSASIFSGYELVGRRILELISDQDKVRLINPISEKFDAIHINWMAYTTDTTNLRSLVLTIDNLDCNIDSIQSVDGTQEIPCAYVMYLDPRADSNVYSENIFPPIDITLKHNYNFFDYRIFVNTEPAHAGITVSNPVMVSIAFLKKL